MSKYGEIWNLSALCRCCHADGQFKSLHETYASENAFEVYSVMLQETFDLKLMYPPLNVSYTICDECIVRLRDATKFKQQVISCEKKFEEYCQNELALEVNSDSIKMEFAGDEEEVEITPDKPVSGTKIEEEDHSEREYENFYEAEIKLEDTKTINLLFNDEDNSISQVKCDDKVSSKIKIEERKKRKTPKKTLKRQPPKKYDASLIVCVKTISGDLFSCKICQGSYKELKDVEHHVIKNHAEEKSKCNYCGNTFRSKTACDYHIKKVHKQKTHTCDVCNKVFLNSYSLKDHYNKHERIKKYNCDICNKKFLYKSSLGVHIAKHKGLKKKHVCHLCGLTCNDITNMFKHIRTVHEKIRPFSCEVCPKKFSAKKHLLVHKLMHNGEKNFKCESCSKSYYTLSCLKRHDCKGLGRVYTCKVCGLIFKAKRSFSKHTRSHSGDQFKCNVCGKDFLCKYSMIRHERLHTGEKPFVCNLCPLKFSQKNSLLRHVDRLHVDPKVVKQEKCDLCNRLVSNLKQHMKCHDRKRFPCDLCDKSYSVPYTLNRHKRTAHSSLFVTCDVCNKNYLSLKTLKKHQKMAHSDVKTEVKDFDGSQPVLPAVVDNT